MTAKDALTMSLRPHPQTPCAVLTSLDVEVRVTRRRMHLVYRLAGPADALFIPDYEEPVRSDGLWRETCCEAFLKADGTEPYFEFNLSPSTQWAVYRFTGYREGMRPVDVGAAPVIDRHEADGLLTLTAAIDLSMLPADVMAADWQLGLSCVVAGTQGRTSYWALNHPPEKPDFHDQHCFALHIGAAQRS